MDAIADALEKAAEYLKSHPHEARYTDSAAVATLEGGLKVSVSSEDGSLVTTDMPVSVGGSNTAPSPGWLYRAALAACTVTLIRMRAAMLGIQLGDVEVVVDSESNDFGILGIDASVPAGPLNVRFRVRLQAADADPGALRELVEWAVEHCPVVDATKRAVPVNVEIEAGS